MGGVYPRTRTKAVRQDPFSPKSRPMLKLTKKADYGLIALCHLAADRGGRVSASAKDISEAYRIPLPLLSKVLQKLTRAGMLTSEQGTNGGYRLSRDARDIS